MTLKEQVYQDVYDYVLNRKEILKRVIVTHKEDSVEYEIVAAQIVEMMMIEKLILNRFAEHNTKQTQPEQSPGSQDVKQDEL